MILRIFIIIILFLVINRIFHWNHILCKEIEGFNKASIPLKIFYIKDHLINNLTNDIDFSAFDKKK